MLYCLNCERKQSYSGIVIHKSLNCKTDKLSKEKLIPKVLVPKACFIKHVLLILSFTHSFGEMVTLFNFGSLRVKNGLDNQPIRSLKLPSFSELAFSCSQHEILG
jgi:hypothetical protein